MYGQRSNSVPAPRGEMTDAFPVELFPLSKLVAGPSRRPPPSPTTGPRFRTAIHYRSYADRELKRKLHESHIRLVDTFEAIGQKYGSVPLEEDDEIDIFTGKITRDRGRLRSLEARPFAEGHQFFGEAVEDDGEPPKRWQSEPVGGPESVAFGDDEDELGDWDERSGLDPQMPPQEVEQPWTTEDLDDLNSFLRAEAANRERSASRGVEYDDQGPSMQASESIAVRPASTPSARLEDLFLEDSEEEEDELLSGQRGSAWKHLPRPVADPTPSRERLQVSILQRPSSSTGLYYPTARPPSSRTLTSSQSLPNIRSALRPPTSRFHADRYTSQQGASRRRESTGPQVRWSDFPSPTGHLAPTSPMSAKARGKQRMVGERPGDMVTSGAGSSTQRRAEQQDVYGHRDEEWASRRSIQRPTPAPPAMSILNGQAWWKRRSESPAVWDDALARSSTSHAPARHQYSRPPSSAAKSTKRVPARPSSKQSTPTGASTGRPRGRPSKVTPSSRSANSKTPQSASPARRTLGSSSQVSASRIPCSTCVAAGGERALLASTCRGNTSTVRCPYGVRGIETLPSTSPSAGDVSSSTDASTSALLRPLRASTAAKAKVSAALQLEIDERRNQRRRSTSVSARPAAPRFTARMKRERSAAAEPQPVTSRPKALESHFYDLHVLARGGVVKCHACKAAGGVRAEWAGYCRGRSRPKLCAFLEDELDLFHEDSAPASSVESPLSAREESPQAAGLQATLLDDESEYEWNAMGEPHAPRDSPDPNSRFEHRSPSYDGSPGGGDSVNFYDDDVPMEEELPGQQESLHRSPLHERRRFPSYDDSPSYGGSPSLQDNDITLSDDEDEQEVQAILSSDSDSEDDAYMLSDAEVEVADDSEWEDINEDERQIIVEHLPGTTANYSLPPEGEGYTDALLYNGKDDFARCENCLATRGKRAEQSMWCKGRDDGVSCPLGPDPSPSRLSRRSKSEGAKPSKVDTWIQAQGDLFSPPKPAQILPEAMELDSAPESSQPPSPVSSTSARAMSAGPTVQPRTTLSSSASHTTGSRIAPLPRAMTTLPTPPRSKSISTDGESSSDFRRAATVTAPYSRPTPPPSHTPEPSSSTAKKTKLSYWTIRTPVQIPSSDAAIPSSASASSDYDIPSSEPPEDFPEDLLTRASDLGINLGPAPTGRISTSLLSALAPSPRRVEPLSASLSNTFKLSSPPPRSPASIPARSKSTAVESRSEPTRASTAGLMLPPPIPLHRSVPRSASPATPRKRTIRDPDEDDDLPNPSPQKRRSITPNTAQAATPRLSTGSTPTPRETPQRTKDETELELARIAAEMGDDAGLEWGLDEDAGDISREFREGSVVVYART